MSLAPGNITLVYADAALLVLDKPAGLLCVPGREAGKQDCLSTRAQAAFPDALIVHRLDMATSGLVLMARGIDNQRRLSAAFEARKVAKRYIAQVAGTPAASTSEWSSIDLPMGADWPNRPKQKIDAEQGKPSVTRWRFAPGALSQLCMGMPSTTIELEPVTGRTHQLRVHMAAIGHPILGDRLYAPPLVADAVNRLMLHAATLGFEHPVTGGHLQFASQAPFLECQP